MNRRPWLLITGLAVACGNSGPGRTNNPPPLEVTTRLVVAEDGRCFTQMDGGNDLVQPCGPEEEDNACGEPIECPPEAAVLLEEHRKALVEEQPPTNPPAPSGPEDVVSEHTQNPPAPPLHLVVATDGRCFQGPAFDYDLVKVCGPEEQDNACGEPIACPPHAATLLAEYNEPPRTNNPPPTGR